MKRLEVRCCCDPTKVLGYLAHPNLQKPGDRMFFPVIDNSVLPEILVVPGVLTQRNIPMRELELTVEEVVEYPHGDFGPPRVSAAIKNRDYPLEDLKLIKGFEPATWEVA